ncbi:unnamed protein product [Pleuronectes platessa]|uniref:Uncharacterized protein n=1 Tax=Pleuronectes platessa TaxID=8262 RepID=A0A9N7YXH1_PLEPL|nr:unnamed protein product [Pleuronectes platessa]
MFEDPLTELWLAFAHGNLAIFSETIKKLEGQDRCAVESAAILREVEIKLTARRDDSFIPVLARGLLGELAILIVKTNINLPCDKFMEMLAKDRAIQKKIHSSEKYANQAPEAEVDE